MSNAMLTAKAGCWWLRTEAPGATRADADTETSAESDPRAINAETARLRWSNLKVSDNARQLVLDAQARAHAECYQHNIENYIGTVKVPVGLAGPLRVHGRYAAGDFHLPLATTEATLVASYSRGAGVITHAGG